MSDTPANLFDTVPATLFAPLAAPSRRVYAAALLRLYDLAQGVFVVADEAALEAVLDVIANVDAVEQATLAGDIAAELQALGEETAGADQYRRQRAEARAILRRLETTGWIKRETQRDFSVQYTLPDYTFALLEGFRGILDRRPPEFEGMIYDTYLLLTKPDHHVPGYVLLGQAYDQTRRVVAGLKQLQHNIGAYLAQMASGLAVREVLQSFRAYRAEIAPNYHRLKTADHVSRYRLDIQQTIGRWLRDTTWMDTAVQEALRRRKDETADDIRQMLIDQLTYIQRQFDAMDEVMALIDERHSRYAEATVTQVQYRVADGQTPTARLAELGRRLGSLPGRAADPAPPALNRLFRLFEIDWLGRRSLYTPPQAAAAYEPPPLRMGAPDPVLTQALRAELARDLDRLITPERVWAYLQPVLADREAIESEELPLETMDDWLLLIGLRIYADLPDSPYGIADPPAERPWVTHGPFRYPNLRWVATPGAGR